MIKKNLCYKSKLFFMNIYFSFSDLWDFVYGSMKELVKKVLNCLWK